MQIACDTTDGFWTKWVLIEFPYIYPLLEFCDIYLGDCSSVGYDFLHLNRPMYFLNPHNRDSNHNSCFLHQYGVVIPKRDWAKVFHYFEILQLFSLDFR